MQAETCYRNALRGARQMGARAWEQRAARSLGGMSLAKVQGQPG